MNSKCGKQKTNFLTQFCVSKPFQTLPWRTGDDPPAPPPPTSLQTFHHAEAGLELLVRGAAQVGERVHERILGGVVRDACRGRGERGRGFLLASLVAQRVSMKKNTNSNMLVWFGILCTVGFSQVQNPSQFSQRNENWYQNQPSPTPCCLANPQKVMYEGGSHVVYHTKYIGLKKNRAQSPRGHI